MPSSTSPLMFALRQIKAENNEAIDDAGGASWSNSHEDFKALISFVWNHLFT